MYLNIINKQEVFIVFGKRREKGNMINFDEINLDEYYIYKATNRFKLINKEDIGKYAVYLIIKKDHHHYTNEFIEWNEFNKLRFLYLNHPITFNPDDIKIIDSI